MKKEQFFSEFRQEHREIRDYLLDMIGSLMRKDIGKTGVILSDLNDLAGPHFRYEEEALYPALIEIYGEAYIMKLLTDHDLAIARAKKLKSTIEKEEINDEEITDCINTVRSILPHVSDCEGLTIMVEKLDNSVMDTILSSMEKARAENAPLLEWAVTGRNRKPLIIH